MNSKDVRLNVKSQSNTFDTSVLIFLLPHEKSQTWNN